MLPFRQVSGIVAALPGANIDTDVIMPKRYLKIVDRHGLADGTLHDVRFDEQGNPRPDFVLNKAPWTDAVFLVVGPNFGCGSSREHAVWGLGQLGVRAIIGSSFGGIFFDNAARNGLLVIELAPDEVARLQAIADDPEACRITVDLEGQQIVANGDRLAFAIDSQRRDNLLTGADAIDAALAHEAAITCHEGRRRAESPWLAGFDVRRVP